MASNWAIILINLIMLYYASYYTNKIMNYLSNYELLIYSIFLWWSSDAKFIYFDLEYRIKEMNFI